MTTTRDSTPSPDASHKPSEPLTHLAMAMAFSDAVKNLAGIMAVIPYRALADAMHDQDVRGSVEQMLNRRHIWAKMFREIADDIEHQYLRLMDQKKQIMEVMDLGRKAKALFTDPQMAEMNANLDQFIRSIRAMTIMANDGSLSKIVKAMQDEIPPA